MITLKNLTKENANGTQEQGSSTTTTKVKERELNLNILNDGTDNNDVTCHIKNTRNCNDGTIKNEKITMKSTKMDFEDIDSSENKNRSVTRTVINIFLNGDMVGTSIIFEDSEVESTRGGF